jgi:hypothetical protein
VRIGSGIVGGKVQAICFRSGSALSSIAISKEQGLPGKARDPRTLNILDHLPIVTLHGRHLVCGDCRGIDPNTRTREQWETRCPDGIIGSFGAEKEVFNLFGLGRSGS